MHTYASVADLAGYFTDGSRSSAAYPAMLGRLEAASRRVDAYCQRSRFGSDFGVTFATRRYSGPDPRDNEQPPAFTAPPSFSTPPGWVPWPYRVADRLYLDADLLALTGSVSVALTPGGTPVDYVEDSDFSFVPYDRTPKRALVILPRTTMILPHIRNNIGIPAKWGHDDIRWPAAATMAEIADTTTAVVTPSAIAEFSPGQTLWVDDEMLYVRSVGTSTLTVVRGANGSIAATHADAAPIQLAGYDPRVVDATLQIAARRWRWRDTNQASLLNDAPTGMSTPGPGELSILRNTVADLRCYQYRWEVAEAVIA